MEEIMPIPVTTTRLINASCASTCEWSASARLQHRRVAEQADLEVHRPIDDGTVRREPSIGNAENELGTHHPLDVDAIHDILHRGQDLAGELELTPPERPPIARPSQPAKKEAEQLPQRIDPEASRHHRIALEMAGEEPEVRPQIE